MTYTAEFPKQSNYPARWSEEKARRELRLTKPDQTVNTILYLTAKRYNLSLAQLVSGGNRKFKELVYAREVLVQIFRVEMDMSQPQVAVQMGYTAPSSVLLAECRVTEQQKVEAVELLAQAREMCR